MLDDGIAVTVGSLVLSTILDDPASLYGVKPDVHE
jgi:hypothetical protein